jgi:hypothetical protein
VAEEAELREADEICESRATPDSIEMRERYEAKLKLVKDGAVVCMGGSDGGFEKCERVRAARSSCASISLESIESGFMCLCGRCGEGLNENREEETAGEKEVCVSAGVGNPSAS